MKTDLHLVKEFKLNEDKKGKRDQIITFLMVGIVFIIISAWIFFTDEIFGSLIYLAVAIIFFILAFVTAFWKHKSSIGADARNNIFIGKLDKFDITNNNTVKFVVISGKYSTPTNFRMKISKDNIISINKYTSSKDIPSHNNPNFMEFQTCFAGSESGVCLRVKELTPELSYKQYLGFRRYTDKNDYQNIDIYLGIEDADEFINMLAPDKAK